MTSFFQISQLFKNQRLGYSTDSTPYWIGIIASINDTLCLVAMWPLKTVIAQKEALYTVFRSSQDGYWSYNRPRVWGLLRQPMDPFVHQWHISKRGPPFTPKNGKPGLHYNHGIRYCHLKTTTTFFDLGLLLWKIRGFEFLIGCNPAAGLVLGIVYNLIQKITFYFSFLQRYTIYYSNITIDVFTTLQISYCSQMIANFYSLHFS